MWLSLGSYGVQMCFKCDSDLIRCWLHRDPLKKLYQEECHKLNEGDSLKNHLREAWKIVREDIGQLLKFMWDEDTGKHLWKLVRAPWTPPSSLDEELLKLYKNKVSRNAL